MQCNVCKSTKFVNMGTRKNALCKRCGSLERTRALKLFIDEFVPLDTTSKVLHIAPERGLAESLYKIAGDNCTFVDLQPENFKHTPNVQRMDLCKDLPALPADQYDLIIHSHVLEHVPCNYTYVLFHMHRLLKPTGKMICIIPVMGGNFDSCFDPALDGDTRQTRFGQNDHVTRFGKTDLSMTLGTLYDLPEYDLSKVFTEELLLESNIPETAWRGYTPHTVLMLGKDDYKLR